MKTWLFFQFYGQNLLLMQEYVTIFVVDTGLLLSIFNFIAVF